MSRVSQVLSPALRDRKDITVIKGNNGYFYVESVTDEWIYWGFPVQVEQRRVIDAIEVEIFGAEIEAGGYIGATYYTAGESHPIEEFASPFGTQGAWSRIAFTKNDIWITDEPRTYWITLKTKSTRGENFRVGSINVVY